MSSELNTRARQVLAEAMERPKDDRRSFVESACEGDEALRKEVLTLIEASDRAGDTISGESSAKMCLTCDGSFLVETKFCPHCGQPLHDDPKALVGTRLDNLYQIEAFLGRGGMGAVYKARHTLLGDLVAIKTLKKELSDDPTFLKRFQREGQAARSFRHPNSVTVHDLRSTPAGLVYMVLEYIEGVNLREYLHGHKRLSVRAAVALLTPIAGALDAAHRRGVVHRDMKPENVMVTTDESGDPHVKVLDLGLATIRVEPDVRPETALTTVGTVVGTPHYMSPEQWGAPSRDGMEVVDQRADVYSLGVMAFEMLTGEWPFKANSVQAFRTAHCTNQIPMASDICAEVPEKTSEVVAMALAKDRADRWPSAGAFVAALEASATDEQSKGADDGQWLATVCDDSPRGAMFEETIVGGAETGGARVTNETLVRASLPAPRSGSAAPGANAAASDASAADFVTVASPVIAASDEPGPVPEASRRSGLLAAGGLAAAIALGALAMWSFGIPPFREAATTPSSADGAAVAPVASILAPDVLRFGLDVKRKGESSILRVSGSEPLGRIEGFRLVLRPGAAGWIAVIGPNRSNVPTLFLPVDRSNKAGPDSEIVFPKGQWIGATGETPSDTLTVVIVPEGAQVPAFAVGAAGRQLLPDEQRELDALRAARPLVSRFEQQECVFAGSLDGRPVVADIVVRY